MIIEEYYATLAIFWIGWLLLFTIITIKNDILHNMVIIRKRNQLYRRGWDEILGDNAWVLQEDPKKAGYSLKSEVRPSKYEILLLVVYPFLLPVFGGSYWVKRKPINVVLGFLLTLVLIAGTPYLYNFVSGLSITFEEGVLGIRY